MSMMYYSSDLDLVFYWSNLSQCLVYCLIDIDGTFDPEFNEHPVDESRMSGESVSFEGEDRTSSEIYRIIERRLGITQVAR